jgi:hypothetical protein
MVAADGGRPFPQGTRDDRSDTRCEPVRHDRYAVPSSRETEGRCETADARSDDEYAPSGGCPRMVRSQIFANGRFRGHSAGEP